MNKPERLVHPLNVAWKNLLNKKGVGTISVTVESLKEAFVDEVNKFLGTNLIYWQIVNIDRLHGRLIFIKDTPIFLATFVPEGKTNEDSMIVPIRTMTQSNSIKYYMLPKIFPAGTYYIGGQSFSLDKSGNISPVNLDEQKMDVIYKEIVRSTIPAAGEFFKSRFSVSPKATHPVLMPENAEIYLYRLEGFAEVNLFAHNALVARIEYPVTRSEFWHNRGHDDIGFTAPVRGYGAWLEMGLKSAWLGNDVSTTVETGALAYNGNDHYKVEYVSTCNLWALRPIAADQVEEHIKEDQQVYYINESRLVLGR